MNNRTHPCLILVWICLAMATHAIAQPTEPDAPIRGWGFDEFHIGGETGYHPQCPFPHSTVPLCVGDAHLTLSANRVRYFVFGSKHSFIITTQIAGGQP